MKRILALAYLGFMLFALSSTAENAISINILGNEQEDARFYFLECREEILNETNYKISYKNANITVEDLSLLTNREYDAVLLYQKVLQAAVERDLLLPINDTALNHDWTALAVYLSKDDVMYGLPYYYIANLFSLDDTLAHRANFQFPQSAGYSLETLLCACNQSDLSQTEDICLMYTNLKTPLFLMQYLSAQYNETGDLQFDTAVFRRTISCYAEMVRKGYIMDYDNAQRVKPILRLTPNPDHYVPFPNLDGMNCIVVDLYALCIPKSTEYPQKAQNFLSDFADEVCQSQIALGNWSQMVYQSPEIYGNEIIDKFPFYSENLRQEMMNDGVPRFPNTEFIRYLNQTGIITDYVNQEMTIDELIAVLQQKWDEIE